MEQHVLLVDVWGRSARILASPSPGRSLLEVW